MPPNSSASMEDLQPHVGCNIADPTTHGFNKVASTQSAAESQTKPPKHSFYRRFRRNPATKEAIELCPNPSIVSTDEVKSVQSLKQFWINAFGSITNSQKKDKPLDSDADTNCRKCSTLGPTNKRTTLSDAFEKGATLHRNFRTSSSDTLLENILAKPPPKLNSNRLSVDNFYKYKNADLVKRRYNSQNSSGDDPAAPVDINTSLQSAIFETDTTSDGITMQIRPTALATDVSQNSGTDKIAVMAETPQSKPSQLIKTDSSNSLATSTTTDSVSSSRKSNSTHHGGVTRKCSFRTNLSYQSNHNHHRKLMVTNSSNSSASSNSKVAALTHRFNQLCQQDADRIREELRLNKQVIVHRLNGKVFKVMAEDSSAKKVPLVGRNSSDNSGASPVKLVSKKGSTKRKERPTVKSIKTVKEVADSPKPKVPEKSPQVIMRTKEIVDKKKAKSMSTLHEVLATHTSSTFESSVITSPTLEVETNDTTEFTRDIASNNPTSAHEAPSEGEEENPKKKKYIRLYEKFRFRPSFLSSSKKNMLRAAPEPCNIPSDPDLSPNDPSSVQKIVEAITKASQRIELLSKSESCLLLPKDETSVIPNESFLFRATTNGVSSDYHQHVSGLVEAINPCVLGKARSMDEVFFAKLGIGDDFISPLENFDNHNCISDPPVEVTNKTNEENDYEIIAPPKDLLDTDETLSFETQPSFLYRSLAKPAVLEESIVKSEIDCSDIYQSIAEVFNTSSSSTVLPIDQESVNSYESFENYESLDNKLLANIKNPDGYEPLDPPPEPPPPRLSTSSINLSPALSDPPLPVPKRNFQNFKLLKADSSSSNYELIKYDKTPPRPPKCAPLPPDPSHQVDDTFIPEIEYDTENIYDTIAAVARRLPNAKSTSSYYESVGRQPSFVRNKRFSKISIAESDSGSTLSSDNKTNSLYGTALSRRESVSPPSESADNNSDDWVDISDGEADEGNKLIVVCERKRPARVGPDWSQMVRDQRMQNQLLQSEYNDDDSDHYYESLHPTEDRVQTTTPQNSSSAHLVNGNSTNVPRRPNRAPKHGHRNDAQNAATVEEDYDSFDTDDDSDTEDLRKNDSGVDVSNNRLPDPPTPTNQVYAFMQKIRNFGSLSKNLSKLSKKSKSLKADELSKPSLLSTPNKNALQSYENTTFYVNVDLSQSAADKKKARRKAAGNDDPYENTEFHAPRRALSTPYIEVIVNNDASSVSPVIQEISTDLNGTQSPKSLGRKKSKSEKSLKSKLRKSLCNESNLNLGTSFNGTRSTFYISDSADIDSGVFTNSGSLTPPKGSEANLMGPSDVGTPTASSNALTQQQASTISPEVTQRKSSLTVRPNIPPPPPPNNRKSMPCTAMATPANASPSSNKRLGTTSWYAECGVFKLDVLKDVSQLDGTVLSNGASLHQTKEAGNGASLYADAGLYQTSGASVTSSSGSSGVSTGGSGDDHSHSMFLNEPLYQIYSAAKLESISNDIEMDSEEQSDGYEEVGHKSNQHATDKERIKRPNRPTALELVGPKGPSRTLWSEIPEVINSEILSTLTLTEKRLQESKFEILTSEASYLKSLTLLRTHFMNHPAFRDTNTLSAADRKTLFAYMISVQDCSDRLLCDLENCWQDNIMLLGLSHSVYKHAEKYFHVYVSYCEHQDKLDRTLKRLKGSKNSSFYQNLNLLESNGVCCGLSLHSFLMLPMQRITRLPLLVDAVISKLKSDDDEYDSWKMTLAILNKIVGQCNEAAKRSAQAFELEVISRQIEFPQTIRPLAIVPVGTGKVSHRSLVRRGELTHIVWRGDDGKLTFGKRFSRSTLYAFLFTDLLVLAKKRDGDTYSVVDYCERLLLTVTSGEVIPQLPSKDVAVAGKHLICMTLLENHEGKMTEMIFACASETDRQRWLNATEPPSSENPDEKLYEQWDCPQVMAKHRYEALQPDELGLEAGDVVNVTRKMTDGWYQGERLRDGAQGWFPGNYTDEVASSHVRARNLKQRYRLLTFTAAYYDARKRK